MNVLGHEVAPSYPSSLERVSTLLVWLFQWLLNAFNMGLKELHAQMEMVVKLVRICSDFQKKWSVTFWFS